MFVLATCVDASSLEFTQLALNSFGRNPDARRKYSLEPSTSKGCPGYADPGLDRSPAEGDRDEPCQRGGFVGPVRSNSARQALSTLPGRCPLGIMRVLEIRPPASVGLGGSDSSEQGARGTP